MGDRGRGIPLIEILWPEATVSKKKPDPKPPGTSPYQMRLGTDTKTQLDAIREHFGLSSLAETVRFMAKRMHAEVIKEKSK